jgi:ribosomal protein S20
MMNARTAASQIRSVIRTQLHSCAAAIEAQDGEKATRELKTAVAKLRIIARELDGG